MFDKEEHLTYEIRMQSLADVESKITSAEGKGPEKGICQASKAIALNMLGKGIDIATISEITGLTESFVETFLTNKKR